MKNLHARYGPLFWVLPFWLMVIIFLGVALSITRFKVLYEAWDWLQQNVMFPW